MRLNFGVTVITEWALQNWTSYLEKFLEWHVFLLRQNLSRISWDATLSSMIVWFLGLLLWNLFSHLEWQTILQFGSQRSSSPQERRGAGHILWFYMLHQESKHNSHTASINHSEKLFGEQTWVVALKALSSLWYHLPQILHPQHLKMLLSRLKKTFVHLGIGSKIELVKRIFVLPVFNDLTKIFLVNLWETFLDIYFVHFVPYRTLLGIEMAVGMVGFCSAREQFFPHVIFQMAFHFFYAGYFDIHQIRYLLGKFWIDSLGQSRCLNEWKIAQI